MTYKEAYSKAKDIDELKSMAKQDAKVAVFLGGNPDRLKAIEDAVNEIANQRGW